MSVWALSSSPHRLNPRSWSLLFPMQITWPLSSRDTTIPHASEPSPPPTVVVMVTASSALKAKAVKFSLHFREVVIIQCRWGWVGKLIALSGTTCCVNCNLVLVANGFLHAEQGSLLKLPVKMMCALQRVSKTMLILEKSWFVLWF